MTKNITDCQIIVADNDELNIFVDNDGLLNKVNIKSLANKLFELINGTVSIPPINADDEGKILRVINGIAVWAAIPDAKDGEL